MKKCLPFFLWAVWRLLILFAGGVSLKDKLVGKPSSVSFMMRWTLVETAKWAGVPE